MSLLKASNRNFQRGVTIIIRVTFDGEHFHFAESV